MLDQLKRMAVLAAVVRHGSFAAAARVLRTSTSAVSQQVRALEKDMGVTLLHRSTRKLSLTPAGERFHAGCAAMVAAAEAAQAQLLQLRDAPEGELRIAMAVGFGRQLGPALAPLLAAHPGLRLHLQVEDGFTDLVAHRIDLAIRFGRLPDSSWVAQRIGTLHTGLYAAPAYLAQRGVPATWDALRQADWLLLQDGTDQARRFAGSELSVQPRYTSNNQLTLQQLCEAGLGLAPLGDEDVAEAVAAGRLLRVDTELALPELPVWALTPQRDAQPAKVRHAIAALKLQLAEAR
ncbi:LysR family transcriptional regulator [Roseateles saccharophilus]|uniref:LysR family transcriptional regulator n=1 Tax=Roseateles saccharophilus TaxID=304 RepID=A0A4R3VEC1_ROSSA|nr:LysR family transcriptional regulator [Roseateles saccharophilus]MDG0833905.1 LysR family transcriptional regulator [Roseateles saccharophilus]TCV02273.1 LysR family transcriptional regulator [Roseateles saccharophilus]